MNAAQIAKRKASGYGVGDAGDFLGLTTAEREQVELGVALVRAIRAARTAAGVTQAGLAKRLRSSQPTVAKIEAGLVGVTLDLGFRALFELGGTLDDVARERKNFARAGAVLREKLAGTGPKQGQRA